MAEQPCIQCGECAAPCPAGIHPQRVLAALRCDDRSLAQHLGLDACMACGRCDAVCPSLIPLTDLFTAAHTEIARERERAAFAMASRERYRTRTARLDQERLELADERQNKRANHAAAAAVNAALERAKARRQRQDDAP